MMPHLWVYDGELDASGRILSLYSVGPLMDGSGATGDYKDVIEFFSDDQRDLIREIFKGIIQPDWHAKIDRQLEDDAGGYGNDQNIAIFGEPGKGPFEFVMTGRHMTLRCDGNTADHVAFGGSGVPSSCDGCTTSLALRPMTSSASA